MSGSLPPPRLARRVLAKSLPADARDHIIEDLGEVHRRVAERRGVSAAHRWYWRQALAFSAGFVVERLRDKVAGRPSAIEPHHNRRGPMRSAIESWTSDFRQALRRLLRAPAFALVTIATLALAIGANTAIFSVVDAVLIDPLPYPNANRLVTIRGSAPGVDMPPVFATGAEFYVAYRDGSNLLEDISMFQMAQTTARTDKNVDRLFVVGSTSSLLSTLGVQPLLGRLPSKQDDLDRANVVVISHSLWTTWFGADPAVIGRSFEVLGAQRTVIGVMKPDFRFPNSITSVWIRATIDEKRITPGRLGFPILARLKPGVTTADLTAQLSTIAKGLPERFGGPASYARLIEHFRPVVHPLEEDIVGSGARSLWILFATAGVVFLIACANVANLFIARAESRRIDLAVRSALGAGRAGLIRSQMAEALLLAVAGGAVGTLIAGLAVPLLVRMAPEGVPNLDLVRLSPLAMAFTAGLSLLGACAFGLLPAFQFSRRSALGDLRQTGRVGSRQGHFARNALVVVQTASALVLLVAAGLLVRSFQQLSRVELGFDTKNIFTFQVAPQRPELRDGPTFAEFHKGLLERLAAMPDVESVGFINELPLDEGSDRGRFSTERTLADGQAPLLPYSQAGGDYFKTMKIPLVSGRLFESGDHVVGMANVVVSRAAAQLLWPNEDPIGKRLRLDSTPSRPTDPWLTVIGVVGDVRLNGFRQPSTDPMIYLAMVGPTATSWAVGSPAYVVKSRRAAAIGPDIRALLREYAPEAPMYRIFTMEGLADRALAQLSFATIMVAIASGLALVLGAVGLYGVLSYVVSQRSREIAVRIALGAETSAVRRMVVLQGARVALAGVVVGVAIAAAVTSVLKSLLFNVSAFDGVTFAAMTGLILAVAMLASYIPARSASALDPMQALRRD